MRNLTAVIAGQGLKLPLKTWTHIFSSNDLVVTTNPAIVNTVFSRTECSWNTQSYYSVLNDHSIKMFFKDIDWVELPLIPFDSYLRSETNSYLMFLSHRVNWTWWRRASFHLKAFPVLIKQVSTQSNWFLFLLDLHRSFFSSFSIVLSIIVNLSLSFFSSHVRLITYTFLFSCSTW